MPEARTCIIIGSTAVLGLGIVSFVYRQCFKKQRKRAVVQSLVVYPIKSCAGITLSEVEIERYGPSLDRAWTLVNSDGKFQNQISIPQLALVQTSFEDGKYLCLDAPSMPTLKLDIYITDDSAEKQKIEIYRTYGEGLDCGDKAAQWFDKYLGKTGLRLYNGLSKTLQRRELKSDPVWHDAVKDGDRIVFSNAAPVMLVSQESLVAVNKEMSTPVDMKSFRPNIVVSGCAPFEEDVWNTVKIGNVILRKFKNIPRCPLTTIDQDSGVVRENGDPLETLKRMRVGADVIKNVDERLAKKPLFGVYFIADQIGTITIGDDVIVLS